MIHKDARFTESERCALRTLYASGMKQYELAQQFNTTQSYISKIIRGGNRYCVECHAPIPTARKRCDACRETWQKQYFQHWYEQSGRRGHVRRNRKRVPA